MSGAGARLRQDARAEPLPGCRESSRSGPGGKPGRSRTRSGLVKGETYCGVKGQPWPNKVLDATLSIGLLSVTLCAELTASPGKAS